jgi:hypothetical protein
MDTKNNIKVALFDLLAREDLNSIKYSAVCIAAIGAYEIPRNLWPDLIEMLCKNCLSDSMYIRMASLQTLGYLSEDLEPTQIPVT